MEKKKATPPSGRPEQEALPIEEVVHELDDADKVCVDCGLALREWQVQSEDSAYIRAAAEAAIAEDRVLLPHQM